MESNIVKRLISSFILIPIALFFIITGSYFFYFFIMVYFLLASYEWHKMTFKKKYYIPGLLFILISCFVTVKFRGHSNEELYLFLSVIIICIFTDIGGYIFGKTFKGPKIAKKISPNKTYSGVFGSYFLSILSILIFTNYGEALNQDFVSYKFNKYDFIAVLILSTVSQAGDLIISFFKRISNKKDTGKLLPGHGGILDRTDGMIFALPFAYFWLYFL